MNIEDDKINGEELNNILQFPKKESKQFEYMSYEEYNDNQHRLADEIFRDHEVTLYRLTARLNELEYKVFKMNVLLWIMFISIVLIK